MPLWDKSALLWADWKNELVPVLPGARREHPAFSAIKVFNKGQITSLDLKKKNQTPEQITQSLSLCVISKAS